MTPPRNAPKVLERPRPSVMAEHSITVPSVTAKNASGDCALVTNMKMGSRRQRPKKKIMDSARPARPAASPSAPRRLPPPPTSSGATTSSGTTARSWKSSTPKDARPYRVPSCPLSRTSCSTKAEEESASAPPRTTSAPGASVGSRNCARQATAKPVTTYCAMPSTKTSNFMERTFSTESSNPISNKKNMMPNSAKCWVMCRL
mmetsp:Transcript_56673/g.165815  ORF Transcript_56673/g.165815 Transcript_56673/m.165815 type:complete len:203 (+) Transcript_56673:1456-2064(+)